MSLEEIRAAMSRFRNDLLNDTLPFWLTRGVDEKHGGYFTSFDRDGKRLESDKSVWFQGRFACFSQYSRGSTVLAIVANIQAKRP